MSASMSLDVRDCALASSYFLLPQYILSVPTKSEADEGRDVLAAFRRSPGRNKTCLSKTWLVGESGGTLESSYREICRL